MFSVKNVSIAGIGGPSLSVPVVVWADILKSLILYLMYSHL